MKDVPQGESLPDPIQDNDGRISEIKQKLDGFIKKNSQSKIGYNKEKDSFFIENPWSDSSVVIDIPESIDLFSDYMNFVSLPERYTAIYHVNLNCMEFIFTAFPLGKEIEEIKSREFEFNFNGKNYKCGYAKSSDTLINIARYSRPVSQSLTDYRNLQSYIFYANQKDFEEGKSQDPSPTSIGDPLSFWVWGVTEWDDTEILSLIRNLNFMMSYYDIRSPNVVIHTPSEEQTISSPRSRYRFEDFPGIIHSSELDENILAFWSASRSGDTIQRFLFSYRIVEYLSFTYLDAEARSLVKRAIKSPHALSNIDKTTDSVISAIQGCKLSDVQKFEAVIRELVDINSVWKEISSNKKAFAQETRFEGGVKISSLIQEKWEIDDFSQNGLASICRHIRDIRNALSHGRDQRTTMVIAPTVKNFSLLRPWAALMATVAGDVVVNHACLD